MPSDEDVFWMRRALRLTNRVKTHPSPGVGAVVVKAGKLISEGWTYSTPKVHAEAMALRLAGERARGATLYTTLEPCSHWQRPDGSERTPCTHHCTQAGIVRVVAATLDSNPQVSGEGFAQLEAAGVALTVGVCEEQAKEAHRAFLKHQRTGMPYVTHKAAMTLDGKLAASHAAPLAITSEPARRAVHRLRAKSDAVIVGVGTVLADDPELTVRLVRGTSPTPVIFDSMLRTPQSAKLNRPGTLILTCQQATASQGWDAELITLPADESGRVSVAVALAVLAERGLLDVLLESGGALAAAFHAALAVDRCLFFLAPKLIGGAHAPTPLDGPGLPTLIALESLRVRRYGPDIALEGKLLR
ncbi:MAG: bifunctional diaminohydroxyphosphoribosylaminopyrimidine deaminase/5-amino-6-(5-phosphoribosylamino)uracil reductase RibD [Armatimonadetes bacterium]|nr:bifunctional diaminohydroxyphosphoribosylaminopyrimidine deaminase/5-amino-6-(5-phosphoribosylamino)uracil reductase RibD [Armatimonadota bacterium]